MFESETSKNYISTWKKHRKLHNKMDMLRRIINLGVILQLVASIGEFILVVLGIVLKLN